MQHSVSMKRVKIAPVATGSGHDNAEALGVEPLIVALVKASMMDDKSKLIAATSLSNLACDPIFRKDIAKAGGIEPLVTLARCGTDVQKKQAALALKMLAYHDHENKARIAIAGGIEPLVALIDEGNEAAAALSNLAVNDDNRVAIAEAGGIERLVALLRDGHTSWKGDAAAALNNLALNDHNRAAIAEAGAIDDLVLLARDGETAQERQLATNALKVLVLANDENLVAVSKAACRAGLGADGFM